MIRYVILIILIPVILNSQNPEFKIVGYLPEYRMATTDTSVGKYLDHLIYFNLRCGPTGNLDRTVISEAGIQKAISIKERYGIPVQICIAGWWTTTGIHFAPVVTNDTLRANLIQNILDFCLEYGFDGIDYDWEHPQNDEEIEAYADLFEETRTAFEPYDMIVSAAVTKTIFFPDRAYEALDRIHIMAYGQAPFLTYEGALVAAGGYMERNIPREKLFLGTPFYGRDEETNVYIYKTIVDLYNPSPELNYVDGITYQGIEGTDRRILYAHRNNFGGMMIWEVGQDSPGEKSLLKSIRKTVNGLSVLAAPEFMTVQPVDKEGTIKIEYENTLSASGYWLYWGNNYSQLEDSVFITGNEYLLQDLDPDSLYYFKLAGIDKNGNYGNPTKVLAATASRRYGHVLIMNEYDPWKKRYDLIYRHADQFYKNSFSITSAFGISLNDSTTALDEFEVIDWMAGDKGHYDTAIGTDNLKYLTSYLENGGNLLISGSNIGYDLYMKGTNDEKIFYLTTLKSVCKYDAPDEKIAEFYTLETIPGSIFAGISPLQFDDGSKGSYNIYNPDVLYSRGGGQVGLEFSGVQNVTRAAAMYYSGYSGQDTIPGHMVYLTVPLETIYPQESRAQLFDRIISYFMTETGIEGKNIIPKQYEFVRNFPNPFNSETIFEFALGTQGPVQLSIFNILGQIIHTYNSPYLIRGVHQYHWQAGDLPSGIYYYELTTSAGSLSGKALLMK